MRIDFKHSICTGRVPQAGHQTASRVLAHSPLTLPRVDHAVPAKMALVQGQATAAWAHLLKAMAIQGLIPDPLVSEALEGKWTIDALASTVFQQYVASQCGNLHTFNLIFNLSEELPDEFVRCGQTYDDSMTIQFLERDKVNKSKEHLFLCFHDASTSNADRCRRVMKPVYDQLSPVGKKLFMSAYAVLCDMERYTIPMATPWVTRGMSSYYNWRFCSTEKEYLRLVEEEGMTPEEDGYEYTFDDFARSFGPVANHPRRAPRLKVNEAKRLLEKTRRPLERKIAAAMFAAKKCLTKKNRVQFPTTWDTETFSIGLASFVRWSDDDDTYRIVDDYVNHHYEGGDYVECFGVTGYQMSSTDDALKFIKNIYSICSALRALDDLVESLTVLEPED